MRNKSRFKINFPLASKGPQTSGEIEHKGEKIMSISTQELREEMQMFANDARALLNATAGLAEEKIIETRKRLAAALENSRSFCVNEQENAVSQFKVADEIVRGHPYRAMGIAFGIGALIGCVLGGRRD